jgi:ABC-2 type transport system ATP-binding protein
MRRRLDLAASLAGAPSVIFLDEPTTGLDLPSRQVMWQAVRDLAARGVTVFLTTQYLEEADVLAGQIAVIDGGRVVAEGTPAHLRKLVAGRRLDHPRPAARDAGRHPPVAGAGLVRRHPDRRGHRLRLAVPAAHGLTRPSAGGRVTYVAAWRFSRIAWVIG